MSDTAHHEEEALGKITDWRPATRLFRYLRPYSGRVGAAVVLLLIASAFEIIQPLFYKVAIDHYLEPTPGGPPEHTWLTAYLPADPWGGLNLLAVTFGVLLLVSFAMGYAQALLTLMTGQYVMYDLRREIFRHLQKLHIGFYDRNPVGRLVTRVTNDVETLNELFTAGVTALFGDVIVLLGIVGVLFYYNWQLALLTLAVLPLIGAVTIAFRNYARDAFRRTRTAIARINAFLNEHLSGMAVVQLFNREERAARDFDVINEENRRAWRDAILAHALFYPAVEVLSVLAIVAIVVYGGWQVQVGDARLGTIVAFLMYARRFFYPIQDLSEKYGILQQALASSERVFKLLDTAPAIVTPAQARRLPSTDGRGAGKVEFRDVWFAYKDEDWVLEEVSFTLQPGEMCAIVGHTGAGKTTVTNLLLRFYDAQKGQILLDGADLRELDLNELRRQFGIVLQDPFIFSGTLASNVRLGSEHITDDEVERALENVNLGQFLRQLPDGLRHETRERGATLSVGQKQLLSFARALAHDPRILILDEATSSVDTQTEFQIRSALERLIAGRTSIVIAHRLSTVQRADRILVFHKGRLREQGTHQELLAHRGLYYKLYQLQYRDQEVGIPADDD